MTNKSINHESTPESQNSWDQLYQSTIPWKNHENYDESKLNLFTTNQPIDSLFAQSQPNCDPLYESYDPLSSNTKQTLD